MRVLGLSLDFVGLRAEAYSDAGSRIPGANRVECFLVPHFKCLELPQSAHNPGMRAQGKSRPALSCA